MTIRIKRILRISTRIIITLVFLSLFGFAVKHVTLNKHKIGPFAEFLRMFSDFPSTVSMVFKEIRGIPPTYTGKDNSFQPVNKLNYDLYGLNSFYNNETETWDVKLFNFKDDSVLHTWYIRKDNYKRTTRNFSHAIPGNSILLSDRNLVALQSESDNLYRLDRNSNIIWTNKNKLFHHSLNLSDDGNIWVCTSGLKCIQVNGRSNESYYRDDHITKIDIETGEVLYDKSVSEILIENNLKNFVYGFSNNTKPQGSDDDPVHLNDIEPVYNNGKYWKKGDLFLSLRHRSLIIHYRPATGKIIRLLYGPFSYQHDVDIISENEISIFNNNTTNIGLALGNIEEELNISDGRDELVHSEILIYDFNDSSYHTCMADQLKNERIYTYTMGSHEILPSGDVFVESQNDGKIYIMNNEKILLKKQFNTVIDDMIHCTHWIRIYDNVNF